MNTKYVLIASFTDTMDAHIARTKLESEGIPVVMEDEQIVSIAWLYSQAVGGVKLLVPEADLEAARIVLQPVEPTPDEPAWGPCPACGDANVELKINPTKLSALFFLVVFFVPLFAREKKLHCQQCGHEWKL